MSPYTVVWHALAEDELAEIWVDAPNRETVALAADAIDRLLTENPSARGTGVSERSRELTIPPLQVLFRVSASDRRVQVFSVTKVGGS